MKVSRDQCVVTRHWLAYVAAITGSGGRKSPKPVIHLYDERAETTVCRRTHPTGTKLICCLLAECDADLEQLKELKECRFCLDVASRERCARGLSLERRRRLGEAVSHFNELANQQTAFAEIAGAIRRFPPGT